MPTVWGRIKLLTVPLLSLKNATLTSISVVMVPLPGHIPTPAQHRDNYSRDVLRPFSASSRVSSHVFMPKLKLVSFSTPEICREVRGVWETQLALENQALKFCAFRVRFDIAANQGLGPARAAWEQKSWIHRGRELTKRRENGADTEKESDKTLCRERKRMESPQTTALKNTGDWCLRKFSLIQ